MSEWVEWRGKYRRRSEFDVPPNLPKGTCGHCGGLGIVFDTIDEERYDVAVPCPVCQIYCQPCKDWVKREGHVCRKETK